MKLRWSDIIDRPEGFVNPQGHITISETDTNLVAATIPANAGVAIYSKANKFVIAYNNAGTVTYLSIDLDGSDITWTHNTTPP